MIKTGYEIKTLDKGWRNPLKQIMIQEKKFRIILHPLLRNQEGEKRLEDGTLKVLSVIL